MDLADLSNNYVAKVRNTTILYYDKQMINHLTNDHTPTRFDTIVSSSGSL